MPPKKIAKLDESAAGSSSQAEPMQVDPDAPQGPGSSPLEGIAIELMFKVLAYAPEKSKIIRESSKSLGERVDNFAKDPNIPLIEKMTFGNCRLPNTTTPETAFPFLHEAGKNTKFLFYRRLQLMTTQFRGKQYGEAYKQMIDADEGNKPTLGCKRIAWDLQDEDFNEKAAFVSDCMGKKIGKVIIIQTKEQDHLQAMDLVLGQKTVGTLKIADATFKDENIVHLEGFLPQHRMTGVELALTNYEMKDRDTVDMIKHLSKNVSELKVTQYSTAAGNDPNQAANAKLLGKSINWAPVFTEMLGQDHKLDKLIIENNKMPEYLNDQDAYALIDELPKIEDKQVWFEATCTSLPDGYQERVKNGCVIRSDKKDGKGCLRIKHTARGPLEEEVKA